jgi:DNA-binding MarR family transcriptional regulator
VAPLNVTAVQAMVLNALSEQDEETWRDLGEKTRLDSATLTGILDRLESVALVERRSHPIDRRAILVCLTERGAHSPLS